MIAKTYILRSLNNLSRLYDTSSKARLEYYYSKLAILELCGWIEESMDDIVQKCCIRNVNQLNNRGFIEEVIKSTYGFKYKNHFRKMLIQVIGIKGVEKLENKLDSRKFTQLQSTLGTLKIPRDRYAHTHLRGTIISIDAPSVSRRNFVTVYDGLKDIEKKIKQLTY